MTKRHKLLTTILLPSLVGASYGLWGTTQGFLAEASPVVDEQRNAVSVITTKLEAQNSYQVRRQFTGEFMPKRESDLSFQLAGQIDKLFVNDGDSVEEEQILAILDTRRIQAERARLVAEKQQASAVLDELNNGSRQEDIDAAIAQVNELRSEEELRHNRFLRSKSLFKRGAITQDELDQAEAFWKSQEARVSAAEARRDQLVAGPMQRKSKLNKQWSMPCKRPSTRLMFGWKTVS